MLEEVWVASPEPAVGVFTTAGTCQGRLGRHFVINDVALLTRWRKRHPGQARPSRRFPAAIG